MIWPWLDSLISYLRFFRIRHSQPRARNRRPGRRIGRGPLAESLDHDHCHLGQQVAELLQGRYPGSRHPALAWHAGQLVAEEIPEAIAEGPLGVGQAGILAIPRHQHADPAMVKAVEEPEPALIFG